MGRVKKGVVHHADTRVAETDSKLKSLKKGKNKECIPIVAFSK